MTVPVRAGADLRLLRAAVFSAVCVAVSGMGHAFASGAAVPVWAWFAGWAGVLCVVAPLAGRERSLPGISVTLLAGELGLHLVFCIGQGQAMGARPERSGGVLLLAERLVCNGRPGHPTVFEAARIVRQAGIDPARVTGPTHGMPGMAGTAGPSMHAMPWSAMFTPAMLVAHMAAGLVAGWLLRHGEAALWRTVRLSAVVAEHLLVVVPLTCFFAAVRVLVVVAGLLERRRLSRARHRRGPRAGRLRSVVLQHCVIRRGPPAVLLTA